MAEIQKLQPLGSLPGIKRDGTIADSEHYTDGEWVRFQRGRPKKMGGFAEITSDLTGPIRKSLVWSRGTMNALYTFSPAKIEMTLMDANGAGGLIYDRSPAGFTSSVEHMWSVDTLYDDAVGSDATIVVAHPSKSLSNIDDTTATQVYFGLASGTAAFTAITGLTASGGVAAVGPYLVYYGTDGLVGWTDVNQPQVLTTGDAGTDRVTGAKIVKGLSVRSGNGPAALLWSLDSLISMQWVGGDAVFRFDHLSTQTSILSQNSVIEYDGAFFWVGIDRFMAFEGGRVSEVPNQMNLNWFFDNLDFTRRQKVWAAKVPRFGEIWWFYPRGDETECSHAVILNVREKTWYDATLDRSAGFYSQVFRYPVLAEATASENVRLTISAGSLTVGGSIAGATSGATGVVLSNPSANTYKVRMTNDEDFSGTETLNDLASAGTGTLATTTDLYRAYVHEKGTDEVTEEVQSAILSSFTTANFDLATMENVNLNRLTRLPRVEPDFVLTGEMTVEVIGREFAQAADVTADPLTFGETTGKVDCREQRRQIRLKFTSNELGGNYEMGRTLLHIEPGDGRT